MNEPTTIAAPVGGYLSDVFNKIRNKIFVPHSLLKLHNLKLARDMTGAETAIEIGSYKGVTTKRLSRLFKKVVSVEIDPALKAHAAKRCASRPNVEILLGDGSDLLPKILDTHSRALLFLDGHFSGGETGQGDEPEPVLKELDGIAPRLDRVSAVVIDDFRLFGVEAGWPPKSAVFAKLESIFKAPDWAIHVHNDQFLILRNTKH